MMAAGALSTGRAYRGARIAWPGMTNRRDIAAKYT